MPDDSHGPGDCDRRPAAPPTGIGRSADVLTTPTRFLPELCNVRALSLLVLLGELIASVLLLAGDPVSWERFGLLSLFVQWIVLISTALLCAARPYLARLPVNGAATGAFLIILLVTTLLSMAGEWLLGSEIVWLRVARSLVIAAVVSGVALRYFYVQQLLRAEQASALQARIQALQSRIRPHFLFNSMNIIASLIPVDPATAEIVVEDLAALFRASLNDAGNQVPIEAELELCRRYLRIEGLRLDERLIVRWEVEALPAGVVIPLLTLQPLLENAVYHGIQRLPAGGTIAIRIHYADGLVQVRVTNPVPAATGTTSTRLRSARDEAAAGNHMALGNIRTRLEVLYGKRAQVTAVQQDTQFVLDLRYPFRG